MSKTNKEARHVIKTLQIIGHTGALRAIIAFAGSYQDRGLDYIVVETYNTSDPNESGLRITSNGNILENIENFIATYSVDRGDKLETTTIPLRECVPPLEWNILRRGMQIPGIVSRIDEKGVWVNVGLPDNHQILVAKQDDYKTDRIREGAIVTLAIDFIEKTTQHLRLSLIPVENNK
jgi:hypothetical protein